VALADKKHKPSFAFPFPPLSLLPCVQNLSFPGPLGPRIPGPVGQIPSSFFPCSHGVYDLVLSTTDCCLSRAFLDLDYCCTSHFLLRYCLYCGVDLVSRAGRSRSRALACRVRVHPRVFAATADDKIVESEVAPRFTPVVAARRSRPYPRAHPLLRIGDPSPYAPSPALPSVDPTVRRSCGVSILRSYPLTRATRYKPKHSPEALVAIGTSLAGAQTTPPKTLLSSPKRKKLQKPPICRTFTRIPSAQNIPALRKARFAT